MIDRFCGEYRYLSNFYPAQVWLDRQLYPTVEHAYQAAKSTDVRIRALVRSSRTPGDAKRLGKDIVLRLDWGAIKLDVMESLIRQKFRDPNLKRKLLLTGHEELIEGNTWGDTFWGTCRGRGENHLGKILMKVRHEIREDRREV